MQPGFATTPEPSYCAVIFTNQRSVTDENGYAAMADAMAELALKQPGNLGAESARGTDGLGITVSNRKDEASIKACKAVAPHLAVRKLGRERWYGHYELRVAKVERAHSGPEGR
jgi:heme-degrading monooxygenase HmoA